MVVNVKYLELREVVGKFAGLELKEVEDKLTDVELKEVVAMFKEFEDKIMGTEQFGLVVLGELMREDLLLLLRSVVIVGVGVLVEMLTAFFDLLTFFNSFSSLFFSFFNSLKSSLYFLTVFDRLSFFCSTL